MPGITMSTTERDEAQEQCGRVYFPHRLTVLGPGFGMALSAVSLGTVSAGLLGYRTEVRVETDELETAYEVNVPLDGPLDTWTGHARVCATPTLAAVYRPDGRATLHGWRGGGRLFGLKVERAALESTLAELTGRPVSTVALSPSLDLRGAGAQWWALAQTLATLARDPAGPLSRPMVARPLAQSVVAALLYAADHPLRPLLDERAPAPGPASVRRAVDLLEAEPEAPWTVVELARRAGVGSRALQDGFARHVGTSPMRYLRQVRLRRAHADLATAASVAEVASRWGFTHLGRFAAAYRERYGEPPSAALPVAAPRTSAARTSAPPISEPPI